MATRPKAVIESRNGEKFSPITIAKNVLTDDGQNLHDILSDRKEDMITPTIENSSSMFKVGQGDNVDYSSNVVNGAYESLVFKGKSLVNFVRLNSKMTSDSPIDINILPIDHTKTYLLKVRVNEAPTFTNESDGQMALKVQYFSTSDAKGFTAISNSNMVKGYELTKIVAPTLESNTNGKFSLWIPRYISGTLDVDVMFIPYQEDMENWNIPYFEGLCDVKSPILTNVGKNLLDDTNLKEADLAKENITGLAPIKFQPNKPYYVGLTLMNGVKAEAACFTIEYKDGDGIVVVSKYQNTVCTFTEEQAKRIKYTNVYTNKKHGQSSVFVEHMWIIESSETTPYEQYKSNTTTFDQKDDKTIVLRSLPKGVCDTLNVETGEYVQRIGEVNTKSLQTTVNLSTGAEANVVFVNGINGKFIGWNECNVASDKLQWTYRADTNWSKSSSINGIAVEPNGGFWFIVDKTIETKEQANEFLVNLDATIQYELATPIVKQINVEGYPYAYENGHILLESGSQEQSLTPTIEYSIVANRGGQIRSNQRMVERHQKQLDRLQAIILTNLVNTQYEQTLTNLKYDLKNVREEVK